MFDAIVLAGGSGRRLGGVDKPALLVRGQTLLDRVLVCLVACETVVVVGSGRSTPVPVRFVREDPPGGGPVAAIAAALPYVASDLVAVLAADLPFLTPGALDRLAGAVDADGAILTDTNGRDQLLVGVWRTASLRAVLAKLADPSGQAFRTVTAELSFARLTANSVRPPWWDCDTPEDLALAEALA